MHFGLGTVDTLIDEYYICIICDAIPHYHLSDYEDGINIKKLFIINY